MSEEKTIDTVALEQLDMVDSKKLNTVALNIIVGGSSSASILERCLQSLMPLMLDEIVVCVTNPREDRPDLWEVAEKYADHVPFFQWCDDFAAARQHCLNETKSDFIMWCDYDDVIPTECTIGFVDAVAFIKNDNGKGADFYNVDYVTARDPYGAPLDQFPRQLFIRNCKEIYWDPNFPIHECLHIEKTCKPGQFTRIYIEHKELKSDKEVRPRRNLEILEKHYVGSPRLHFYYGRELMAYKEFEKAVDVLTDYIDKQYGYKEEIAYACAMLCHYYAYKRDTDSEIREDTNQLGITFAKICISYSPRYAEVFVALGDIYSYRGAEGVAREFWKAAAQCSPDGPLPQSRPFYEFIPAQRLFKSYFYGCEFERALYYNKVQRDLIPKSKTVLLNRSQVLEILNKELKELESQEGLIDDVHIEETSDRDQD